MGYILLIILAVLAIAVFIVIESAIERRTIELCHYHIKSDKLKPNTKLTFITVADLHSKDFGDENSPLIHAIKNEKPDGILIPGDLIIGRKIEDFTVAINLLNELSKIAPVFYSLGNHEQRMKYYRYNETTGEYETDYSFTSEEQKKYHTNEKFMSKYDHYRSLVDAIGITVLDNETRVVVIKGEEINITGLSIDLSYFEKFNHQLMSEDEVKILLGEDITNQSGITPNSSHKNSSYEILLAHNPVHMEAYTRWKADFIVSGHLHGGIIRLPFIGGVITPQVKFLPQYNGGLYKVNGKSAVVSRGLGEHTVNIRVCNPPELSVIHITHGK